MLQLDIKMRNEIVNVLQTLIAPAQTGAVLVRIAELLSGLKEAEQEVKPVQKKND